MKTHKLKLSDALPPVTVCGLSIDEVRKPMDVSGQYLRVADSYGYWKTGPGPGTGELRKVTCHKCLSATREPEFL